MGITYVQGTVTGPTGKESSAEFLIDTGAAYTLLPEAVWRAIELTPTRAMSFRMVDGTRLERQVSGCALRIPQGDIPHTPVILGEAGDNQALLGVVTLEELGLVFHPFKRQLYPAEMLLI